MIFDDIHISPEFIADYDKAPLDIKSRTDKRLSTWAIMGNLPPSAQAHKAFLYEGIWIVYLNKGKGGWRLLVCISDRKLTFLRLLDHDEVEHVLRK